MAFQDGLLGCLLRSPGLPGSLLWRQAWPAHLSACCKPVRTKLSFATLQPMRLELPSAKALFLKGPETDPIQRGEAQSRAVCNRSLKLGDSETGKQVVLLWLGQNPHVIEQSTHAGHVQLAKHLGSDRSMDADTNPTRMSSKGLLGTNGLAEVPVIRLLWLLAGPDVPMRLPQLGPVSLKLCSRSICECHQAD